MKGNLSLAGRVRNTIRVKCNACDRCTEGEDIEQKISAAERLNLTQTKNIEKRNTCAPQQACCKKCELLEEKVDQMQRQLTILTAQLNHVLQTDSNKPGTRPYPRNSYYGKATMNVTECNMDTMHNPQPDSHPVVECRAPTLRNHNLERAENQPHALVHNAYQGPSRKDVGTKSPDSASDIPETDESNPVFLADDTAPTRKAPDSQESRCNREEQAKVSWAQFAKRGKQAVVQLPKSVQDKLKKARASLNAFHRKKPQKKAKFCPLYFGNFRRGPVGLLRSEVTEFIDNAAIIDIAYVGNEAILILTEEAHKTGVIGIMQSLFFEHLPNFSPLNMKTRALTKDSPVEARKKLNLEAYKKRSEAAWRSATKSGNKKAESFYTSCIADATRQLEASQIRLS